MKLCSLARQCEHFRNIYCLQIKGAYLRRRQGHITQGICWGHYAYTKWPHPQSNLLLTWTWRKHFSLKCWHQLTRLYPALNSDYQDLNYKFYIMHFSPSSHYFLFLISKYYPLLIFLLCTKISVKRNWFPNSYPLKHHFYPQMEYTLNNRSVPVPFDNIAPTPPHAHKTESPSPVRRIKHCCPSFMWASTAHICSHKQKQSKLHTTVQETSW